MINITRLLLMAIAIINLLNKLLMKHMSLSNIDFTGNAEQDFLEL